MPDKMLESLETLEKLKQVPEASGLQESIRRRWSPRAYAEKEVSPADLTKLFEAARWAASSSNEQPWRFLVGRGGDETYRKIFNSLVEFNQIWARSAPVLILSVAKTTFSKDGSANGYALHDTGAATANLALEAIHLGLHTHSMAGFDHEKARATLHIPEEYDIGAVTAVGYLGDPSTLPEKLRTMETAPRQRKPIDAFVFSAWDAAAKF